MKKIFIMFCLLCFFSSPVFAFLSDVKILSKEKIAKLSDEELTEAYVNAKIEREANQEFHRNAGFSSIKEYDQLKQLLRYVFDLRMEMLQRKDLKPDKIDEVMK